MKRPHIHSPVDDLESGFWVTFWSLLFHEDHEGLCSQLEQWARRMFTNNKRQEAAEGNIILGGPKSSIMQRFSSVFEASWDGSVRDKIFSWHDVVARARRKMRAKNTFYHTSIGLLSKVLWIFWRRCWSIGTARSAGRVGLGLPKCNRPIQFARNFYCSY